MLLQNIRAKIGARLSGESEDGFTLIELLVVMLILGILAAIAIPAFFNQASKASDASAKENLHTGQVTVAACLNEKQEDMTFCTTQANLHAIEGAVPAAGDVKTLKVEPVGNPATGYALTSEGSHGVVWKIEYTEANGLKYTCSKVAGACASTTDSWAE